MADARYEIRLFDKALHDRRAFSCGVEAMDRWIKYSVSDQVKSNRLRLWCANDRNDKFAGFYGLTAHSVNPDDAPSLAKRKERRPIPTIYLPALAVDKTCQGQGVGGALLADAIVKSLEISENIGAAALILDVLGDDDFDKRKAFYLKLGFTVIGNGDPKRLFLSI
ncbi:MAG: GNAT family N-acetyltransferase [Desulfobacterium sp.]